MGTGDVVSDPNVVKNLVKEIREVAALVEALRLASRFIDDTHPMRTNADVEAWKEIDTKINLALAPFGFGEPDA